MSSHCYSKSRGVMIFFKPRLDVNFEKTAADNFGRCMLTETIIDGSKIALVNIYAPNDVSRQFFSSKTVGKNFPSRTPMTT